MHRAMCRGSRCNRLAVTVQCHVVSPLTPLLLAGKYHLKGHSTLGVSASAEPFCTAVSGPAAYRRSLCSQGSAAAPRRQLFLAQASLADVGVAQAPSGIAHGCQFKMTKSVAVRSLHALLLLITASWHSKSRVAGPQQAIPSLLRWTCRQARPLAVAVPCNWIWPSPGCRRRLRDICVSIGWLHEHRAT